MGKLCAGLHLPFAGRGRLYAVRPVPGGRRAADDLVVLAGRFRADAGLPDFLRSGFAVPDFRRRLSVGPPSGGQALGVDGRLDLLRIAVRDHCCGCTGRRSLHRGHARLRTEPGDQYIRRAGPDRAGNPVEPERDQVAGQGRDVRFHL
ncbi:hypothetical protein D3C72_1424030 [compost metagenome]